jgi:hypothetical protein
LEVFEGSETSTCVSSGDYVLVVYDWILAIYRQLGTDFRIHIWHSDGSRYVILYDYISFISLALIPYLEFGHGTRIIIVAVSISITVALYAFLLVLFYGFPTIDIPLLTYLNCPFVNSRVCDQQGLMLRNWIPI